jgi:hypothetical protein
LKFEELNYLMLLALALLLVLLPLLSYGHV